MRKNNDIMMLTCVGIVASTVTLIFEIGQGIEAIMAFVIAPISIIIAGVLFVCTNKERIIDVKNWIPLSLICVGIYLTVIAMCIIVHYWDVMEITI